MHEHVIVAGRVGQLRAPIMHENLKGLNAYVARHNRYSDLEAAEIIQPSGGRKPGSFRGSWADPVTLTRGGPKNGVRSCGFESHSGLPSVSCGSMWSSGASWMDGVACCSAG